jgi:chitodextrinase
MNLSELFTFDFSRTGDNKMRRLLSGGGFFAFIFIISLISAFSPAEVYYVPSRDLPNIQSGIDAASNGDTVIVSPGTYSGMGNVDLDFNGKSITLRSEIDPCNPNWDIIDNTIIDCQADEYNPARAFHFQNSETSSSKVLGFTITNGYARGPKGADGTAPANSHYSLPSSLNIDDINTVDPNYVYEDASGIGDDYIPDANAGEPASGDGWGGAILCENNSSPTVQFCIIKNCTVTGAQGGDGANGVDGTWIYEYIKITYNAEDANDSRSPLDVLDDIQNGTGQPNDINNTELAIEEFEVDGGQDGGAGGDGSGIGFGGAVACLAGSSPRILDCEFMNNSARGGVGGPGGNGGDGADTDGDGNPDEQESDGGDAGASYGGGFGGAVYVDAAGGHPVIKNCLFSGNTARTGTRAQSGLKGEGTRDDDDPKSDGSDGIVDANGVWMSGGAIYYDSTSTVDIENCHFTDNMAYSAYEEYDPIDGEDIDYYTQGGAIDCNSNVTADIVDSNFVNSSAGAVYFSINSTVDINNVYFENSTDTFRGGALFKGAGGFLTLIDTDFVGNSAYSDGGALKLESDANMVNCSFSTNESQNGYGGAIDAYLSGTTLVLDVNNCSFAGNTAATAGGGVSVYNFTDTKFANSYFIGNISAKGGGLSIENGDCEFTNCAVTGNTATSGHGGGIYCRNASMGVEHSAVVSNSANGAYPEGGSGGGLYIKGTTATSHSIFNTLLTDNSAEVDGGALYLANALPDVNNCTIADNTAEQFGGGIFADFASSPFITDTILTGNTSSALYVEVNGNAAIEYGLFDSNPDGDYSGSVSLSDILYADPVFVTGPMGNYYLDPNSPAVDSGSDTAANIGLDMYPTDQNETPDSGQVDRGYHYTLSTQVPTYQLTINVIGEGTVTAVPDSNSYKAGTVVNLTAEPASGWSLESWGGADSLALELNNTVIMNSNRTVTVEFTQPKTLIVKVGGGQQGTYYADIQDALHDAVNGDVIVVYPGIYRGPEIQVNKAVEIRSVHPDDPCNVADTIIDRTGYANRGFRIVQGASGLLVNGLTFQNCVYTVAGGRDGDDPGENGGDGGSAEGGAMFIAPNLQVTVKNSLFRDNWIKGGDGGNGADADTTHNAGRGGWGAWARGAAIYCSSNTNVNLINCVLKNNEVVGGNGGNGGDYTTPGGTANYGGNWSRAEWWNIDPRDLTVEWVIGDLWQKWSDMAQFTTYSSGYSVDRQYNIGYFGDYRWYSGYGGAVFCNNSSNVTFTNCEIRSNTARGGMSGEGGDRPGEDPEPEISYEIPSFGGAVYAAANASVTFNDCNIVDNESSPMTNNYRLDPYLGHGGGICAEDTATVIFNNSNIEGNRASAGGGFHFGNANPVITDSNFVNNLAFHGGGIFGERGIAQIKDSNIADNRAELSIYPNYDDANMAVRFGEVWGMGGGLHLWGTSADVNGCYIHDNFAESSGGGAYFGGEGDNGEYPQLFNCLITDNTAGRDGGGVSANIYTQLGIINTTIVNNYVTGAYDIANYGGGLSVTYSSNVDIENSIIWKNFAQNGAAIAVGTGFEFDNAPSNVNISYSNIGPVVDPCEPFEFFIPEPNSTTDSNSQLSGATTTIDEQVISSDFGDDGKAEVIITLYDPQSRDSLNWNSSASVSDYRSDISSLQNAVISSLSSDELTVRYRYDNIAAFSGEITQSGLSKLQNSTMVKSVEPVRELETMLAQGIDLMSAGAYRTQYDGSGLSIAICDTGVDYTHPMLGGGGFPNSKVIGGYDFGEEDADPMAVGNAHGTACAGIAAGDIPPQDVNDYIGGVAPNAKIYALKMSRDNSGSATSDAMVASWDWCVTHKNDDPNNPIKITSTSFANTAYGFNDPDEADSVSPAMTEAAKAAVENNITVLAASGNEGRTNGIDWPSAISYVISVGAVQDIDDTVMYYSNTDEILDILAPSEDAYTADIVGSDGYSSGDYYGYFNGTSAACPYAAGAVAVIQSLAEQEYNTELTPQQIRNLLIQSGDPITDTKVDITKPRVNVGKAINYLPTDAFHVEQNCTLTGWDANDANYPTDGNWYPNADNNISEDPNFIGGYYLTQIAAGQTFDSPCVDAGSWGAAGLGLADSTTRTDGYGDKYDPNNPVFDPNSQYYDPNKQPFHSDIVDMGYHYRKGLKHYELSVMIVDANGDPNSSLGSIQMYPDATSLLSGTIVELTAVPKYGYAVKQWSNTDDDMLTGNTNTVTMNEDKNIIVEIGIRDKTYLSLEVVDGNGVIAPIQGPNEPNVLDHNSITDVYTYYIDSKVRLEATPDPNYRVEQWINADVIPSWGTNENTVTLDSNNITVRVEFEEDKAANRLVPSQYETIQEAIDAAHPGDNVILSRGLHTVANTEGLDFGGKAINLQSENYEDPDVVSGTIINCEGDRYNPARGLHFHNGEDPNTKIRGITIVKGYIVGELGASGVVPGEPISDEDPNITRAEGGEDAEGDGYGGGILCENGSSPIFENCIITNCTVTGGQGGDGDDGYYIPAGSDQAGQWGGHAGDGSGNGYGGAIACKDGSSPILIGCTIEKNTARGGCGGDGGNGSENHGSGNESWGGNGGDSKGDGIGGALYADATSTPKIIDCTFKNNIVVQGLAGEGGDKGPGKELDPPAQDGDDGEVTTYGAISGGAYWSGCTIDINDSSFIQNKAYEGEEEPFDYTYGGAVYAEVCADANQTVTLKGSEFKGNLAGAVYCSSGYMLDIDNCLFEDNDRAVDGGAIYIAPDCIVDINEGKFLNNTAFLDGGAINSKSDANLIDCIFSSNQCGGKGGAIDAYYNPIDPNIESTLYFDFNNCQFAGNVAIEGKNGWGGAVRLQDFEADIYNSYFLSNEARSGGSLFVSGGILRMDNVVVKGNRALGKDGLNLGGGIVCANTKVDITYTNFEDNSSESGSGGAISLYGGYVEHKIKNNLFVNNFADVGGGGISCNLWATPDILNSTFVGNDAGSNGGAVHIIGNSYPTVRDCVFVDCNGVAIYESDTGDHVLVDHSIFFNNSQGYYFDADANTVYSESADIDNIPTPTGSEGTNLYDDPLFEEGPLGTYYLNQANSNAVDNGSASAVALGLNTYTTDPNGDLDEGTVDIGYHYGDPRNIPYTNISVKVIGGHGTFETSPEPVDVNLISETHKIYTYSSGTPVTVSAIPDTGYNVAEWTGTIDNTSKELENVVIASPGKEVTITFEQPRTLLVGSDPNYTTIQHTIDDANDGDIVIIPVGVYTPAFPYPTIEIREKNITITSTQPDDPCVVANTILDSYKFDIYQVSSDMVIDGITIRNSNWVGNSPPTVDGTDGYNGGSVYGGAISVFSGSPVIRNCNFENCSVTGGNGANGPKGDPIGYDGGWAGRAYGGAVYCNYYSSPLFQNCSFENCFARGGNGGNGGEGEDPAVHHGGRGGNWEWAPSVEEDIANSGWWDGWEHGDSGSYSMLNYNALYSLDEGNDINDTYYLRFLEEDFEYNPYDAYIDDYSKYSGYGGAIYCQNNSSPEFIDCDFTNNHTYGGVCGIGGNRVPTPDRNLNIENLGGAIYACEKSNPKFTRCNFTNNSADTDIVDNPDDVFVSYGGAIACEDGSAPEFRDCNFVGNEACIGGGVYWSDECDLTIINSDLTGNTAYQGAGLYSKNSTGIISGTNVADNYAVTSGDPNISNIYGLGGGYFCWTSNVSILDSIFTRNQASASGGGIYYGGSDQNLYYAPTLHNCLITDNNSVINGGGVSVNWYAEPVITNCTIVGNEVSNGYGGGLYGSYDSNTVIINGIVWGNTADVNSGNQLALFNAESQQYGPRPSDLKVFYSNIEGGQDSVFVDEGCNLTWDLDPNNPDYPSNLSGVNDTDDVNSSNPLFVSGTYGDYYLSQPSTNNYDQLKKSPCVDTGWGESYEWNLDSLYTATGFINVAPFYDHNSVDMGYHYPKTSTANEEDSVKLTVRIIEGRGRVEVKPMYGSSVIVTGVNDVNVIAESRTQLTALPDTDWRVKQWNGTDDDSSLEPNNVVTIGDSNQTVTLKFEKTQTISVPGEYTSVQAAIDASRNGDIIMLDTGVYELEVGLFIGDKSIEVTSTQPDNETIVQDTVLERAPGWCGSAVIFSGAGADTVFNGITIRGFSFSPPDGKDGEDPGEDGGDGGGASGGAIGLVYASPTIKNCRFENCSVVGSDGGNGAGGDADNPNGGNGGYPGAAYGGALYIGEDSHPKIINTTFVNCRVIGGNGGDGGDGNSDPDGYGGLGGGYPYGEQEVRYNEISWRGPYYMYSGLGGAVYISEECSPEFIDCNFVGNSSFGGLNGIGGQNGWDIPMTPDNRMKIENRGGAVFCGPNSMPYFENCYFIDNAADSNYPETNDDPYVSYGGGVAFERSAAPVFNKCHFEDNTATVGGGMYGNDDAFIDITDSNFVSNAAYQGGGIYLVKMAGTLSGCEITNNNAVGEPFYDGLPVMDEVLGYGGGIYLDTADDIQLKDTVITDNTADVSGGGVYSAGGGGKADLKNCLIVSNQAGRNGAGVSVNWLSDLNITNCTFAFNLVTTSGFDTGYGGGLFCGYSGYANVLDSIFWANIADSGSQVAIGNEQGEGSLVEIDYTDIQGGLADIYIHTDSTVDYGNDNIFEYPYFAAGPMGDFYLSQLDTSDPNQTLQSPCVDAGSRMASDASLVTYTTQTEYKPDRGLVDMGYHYPPETELAECRICDIYVDGYIDFSDYALFALQWLEDNCGEGNNWCSYADFNFDTQVDYEDLFELQNCWMVEDTGSPIPNPAEWLVEPYLTESGDANMVAKVAVDEWGWDVEYYFDCVTDANHSSGWISENSYLDTGLEADMQYEYRVRVRDGINNTTAWSKSGYVSTYGMGPADAPVLSPVAVSQNSVTLWASEDDGYTNYISYYFERSDVNTFDANIVDTGWQDANSWTDTGLDANSTYWYRIKAYDENGEQTDWSEPVSVTTNNIPPADAPSWVQTPTSVSPSSVVMQASSSDGNLDYQLYYFERSDVNTFDVNIFASGYRSDPNWTNTGLTADTGYWYRVKAIDENGKETDFSAAAYVETSELTAADAPVWIQTPTAISPNSITMQAAESDGTLEYQLYEFQRSDSTPFELDYTTNFQVDANFTDTGLDPNTEYWYRVRAYDENGSVTDWSTVESDTTLGGGGVPDSNAPTPNPPSIASAVEWYDSGAETYHHAVTCVAMTDAEGSTPLQYYFECSDSDHDSGWITESQYDKAISSFSKNYQWRVKVKDNQDNETAWSSWVYVSSGTKPDWVP